jgi:RNA polymerase sigma-70 factor (ECF subfamily)
MRPFLFRRGYSLVRHRELAEDLVQSSIAKALQAQGSFVPGTNLKGWLTTILHNEFYSHKRRSWRSIGWSEGVERLLVSPGGEQESSNDLTQTACALNLLPDEQREALVVTAMLEFAYEESAILFGVTVGTIKSRVSRARIALMQILDRRGILRAAMQPDSPRSFPTWLADIEAIRLVAITALKDAAPNRMRPLPTIPKIRTRQPVHQ